MYRQLTSQDRDLLFRAFGRFASAPQSMPKLEAAAEEYRRELRDAGIVFTKEGFRVYVAERADSAPLAVGKPR